VVVFGNEESLIMPLSCLTCRNVLDLDGPSVGGTCPRCGGPLVGQGGAWIDFEGPAGSGLLLLPEEGLSIGRREDNGLVLNDREVSKLHALIHREGSDWYFRDACSANGSFVNGQRVAEHGLRDGDELTLGKTRLVFHGAGVPHGLGGVTIAPQLDSKGSVQACLKVEPGGFKHQSEIRSEQELREDYERLRLAYLFNRYVGHERDPAALLENILDLAFDMLPADRGAILLREEEGAPLTPALTRLREGSADEIIIPDSILRRAVEERSAVLSADATVDLRFSNSNSVMRESVRSAMCVPLVGEGEVLGVIHLDTREETGAFAVKDLRLLSVLASQAAAVLERVRLHQRLERESQTRERLARFLSPQVLTQVVEQGLDLHAGGRTGLVSVMFCDIRGFTSLSEHLEPTQLVRMLNAYFERMVDVVFAHGGLLDKFIGDALMAVWGTPIPRGDDAARALAAGHEMLEAVKLFNASGQGQGWPVLEIGVGINSGEAVIGTVGSSLRMEYTVMGDTVNLASRICDMARPGQLLITEATRRLAEDVLGADLRVNTLDACGIRGRRQQVVTHEVVALPRPGSR